MPRGLDHIVHAVRDLDAAAELYRKLGFTVGARNKHSWGTHNHIVQIAGGFFIEVLTLAEPEKLGCGGFSKMFGAFNGDFLKRQEGFSLLILESKDAVSDEKSFRAAGVAASDVMRFDREGKRPDGSAVKVAFSLAFAEDARAPDTHFATCQQHFPENFWNPAFQKHGNGVQGVAGVVLVAETPEQHRGFVTAFSGVADTRDVIGGFAVKTPRGEIAVLTPEAYRDTYKIAPPDVRNGARLGALRLNAGNARTIGPNEAMGAAIIFEKPAR
jgi:catechol 2,3-dioxygenase-like lactoylglutathione lyase family enzyme